MALGTVTARGEPRVAPISAFFLRGAFYVPTVAESARARHLARRPAASLTYFERTSLAVIAHGIVEIIAAEHPPFDELDQTQVALGGQSPREWQGRAVYLHLAASLSVHLRRLVSFASKSGSTPIAMSREELRHHIDTAAPGGGSESRRLAALILSACWPGGSEDRTERAALDWLRRWRPEQIHAELPKCSCSTGRCVLCN